VSLADAGNDEGGPVRPFWVQLFAELLRQDVSTTLLDLQDSNLEFAEPSFEFLSIERHFLDHAVTAQPRGVYWLVAC